MEKLFLLTIDTFILITSPLTWQQLLPDTTLLSAAVEQGEHMEQPVIAIIQARLYATLRHFYRQIQNPFLLIHSLENKTHYQHILHACASMAELTKDLQEFHYQIDDNQQLKLVQAQNHSTDFNQKPGFHYADWIEYEQLFGSLKLIKTQWTPLPGLLHQANGGTLLLSVRTLLAQPLLWLRLKKFMTQGYFEWLSPNTEKSLPVSIDPLPLNLRLILTGDRDALAEFQQLEPELTASALYTEYEDQWHCTQVSQMQHWCQWVTSLTEQYSLGQPSNDIWPVLLREAVRYTGDRQWLPINPQWVLTQLTQCLTVGCDLNADNLQHAIRQKAWQEDSLSQRIYSEIINNQKRLVTDGATVGQINGLAVIEYPGHPRVWGEPTRISCVVHFGDGEVLDIERKAELGGNLHAKGMMIIQSYLIAELGLDHQLPFSASIAFEQSYAEVDGDSASLAELSILISALAQVPIKQNIAVTGSIDQFGYLQAVGGLNEKIEGFYKVCTERDPNKHYGVIIPASNIQHLALNDEVVNAVKTGQFSIWACQHATEALPLLMGLPWLDDENENSLLTLIQQRITSITQADGSCSRRSGWRSWFNWLSSD